MRGLLKPKIRLNMSAVNWFELDAEFTSEDQSVDLERCACSGDGGKLIPLKDGAAAPMPTNSSAWRHCRGAGAKTRTASHFFMPPRSICLQLGRRRGRRRPAGPRRSSGEIDGIPPVKAPEGLNAELRHYQRRASLLWFIFRHGSPESSLTTWAWERRFAALALMLKIANEQGTVRLPATPLRCSSTGNGRSSASPAAPT